MQGIVVKRGSATRGRVMASHPNPSPNRVMQSMPMGMAASNRPMPTTALSSGPSPAGLGGAQDGPDFDSSPGAPY